MQVTKQINATRFNSETKQVDVMASFTLTGDINSDYEFAVDFIEMGGVEITGDQFHAEISESPNGLGFFYEIMEQRFEVCSIYIKTSFVVEAHTPVAFPE